MSRDSSRRGTFLSPTQTRACIVVLCCAVAIVLTFILSWILLPNFLGGGSNSTYDPEQYPVDTTLAAILPQGTETADYMADTVMIGDQYMASLQTQGLITLNQFVGAPNLKLSTAMGEPCVYFADDPGSYSIPQALAKMKPRRVLLTLGSNDIAGSYNSVDGFIQAYRGVISAINQAYPYCDIIVNALPPVRQNADSAVARQTRIDQYNQALALMCQNDGYRFLNSSEALKANSGFAQDTYFDNSTGAFTASGGNAMLMYYRQHPYVTEDRRPDTSDIPPRASQPYNSALTNQPSPTPGGITATYTVEDEKRGTLTAETTVGLEPDAKTKGVARLEYDVSERTTITVTAVPADGWVFLKWSDGLTSATRTDVIIGESSVVAMFVQPTINIYYVLEDGRESKCDNGQVLNSINVGETANFTAYVMVEGTRDANLSAKIEWVINKDEEKYDGKTGTTSYSFKPTADGYYDIIVGLEFGENAKAISTYVRIEVPKPAPTPAPETTISIEYDTNELNQRASAHLTAHVENGVGTTTWSCEGLEWTASGNTATFPAPAVTERTIFTIHARNNGADAIIRITVNP